MKNKFNFKVVLLTMLSMFTLMIQPVNAENEQSVQSIIEQVQEHNLREEDVQEELEKLSISELKDVQEYLANKHDVTMIEKQVLNLTQDLLGEGSSVGYVAQESLQTSDRKETMYDVAKYAGNQEITYWFAIGGAVMLTLGFVLMSIGAKTNRIGDPSFVFMLGIAFIIVGLFAVAGLVIAHTL